MRTYLIRIAATAATAVFVGAGFATTAHADEPIPLPLPLPLPLPEPEPEPEAAELCLTLDGKHWIPCDNGPGLDFPELAPIPTQDPDDEEPEDVPELDEPDQPAPKPADKNKPAAKPASGGSSQADTDSSPDEDSADDQTADAEQDDPEPAIEKAELTSQQGTGSNFIWALVAGILAVIGLTILGYGLGKRRG